MTKVVGEGKRDLHLELSDPLILGTAEAGNVKFGMHIEYDKNSKLGQK